MYALVAEAYFHTLNPFAIEFPASWPIPGIRWYGVSYAVGFLIAWLMVRWVARKTWSPIPAESVGDLMFAVIVGVLVGGRVGYAVFYDPMLFIGFTSAVPFWDLLAINKGGMASHGGIIGVILAVWWFGWKHNISVNHMLDVGTLGCSPGLFIGRLANFVNGELWGRPLPQAMQNQPPWWSVKYPEEILSWASSVPPDERLGKIESLRASVSNGEQFLENVVHTARAGNETVRHTIEPVLTAYYPSQIFQAITDGPLLLGFLVILWLKPRNPGVIGSWYLIWYGLLRIASEAFREPDDGVALTFGLLSRGQTLSLLMILSGVVGLWITARRRVRPIGGLFAR